MKKFNVSITCMAVYSGTIEVPDDATFEDALAIAQEELPNIPLGELEYIPDSDTLDEENCSFEDEDTPDTPDALGYTDTQKNVLQQWTAFDVAMRMANYDVVIIDECTRDEETAQFGQPLSALGSTACKDDLWSVYFRAHIKPNYAGMVVTAYDRGGNSILCGRNLGSYTFPEDWSLEDTEHLLNEIIKKYEQYGTDNRVPEHL